MRPKAWLAAPVLLAHAEVAKNIKYFSMGPKLRHAAVLLAPCEPGGAFPAAQVLSPASPKAFV